MRLVRPLVQPLLLRARVVWPLSLLVQAVSSPLPVRLRVALVVLQVLCLGRAVLTLLLLRPRRVVLRVPWQSLVALAVRLTALANLPVVPGLRLHLPQVRAVQQVQVQATAALAAIST